MGCESKAERKVKTHHVFVARLWIIAHLVVLTLASEVTKGVLVLYCWWDTKPIRLIGRWTFEVYHRRNRSEPIVVPFVRPNFLVLDLSMKPAKSGEFVSHLFCLKKAVFIWIFHELLRNSCESYIALSLVTTVSTPIGNFLYFFPVFMIC